MSDSVGSVSVEVVPDARGWAEKLRAQIRDAVVKVQLDDAAAQTKLDVLSAKVDEVGARSPSIKVNADTGEAETKLAILDATAARVTRNRSMGGLGGFFGLLRDIKSKGIFGGIQSGLEGMAANGSKAAGVLAPLAGMLEGFPVVLAAVATTAVPLAGALGGLALALAAPLAIVAGGGTLFAFLAGFAVKDALKQQKNIDTLSKKLAGLKKGTADYAKTQAQLAAAQKALNPAESGFLKALDGLKNAFKGLPKGALLAPLTAGLKLITRLLPDVLPIVRTVSRALTSMIDDLGKSVSSGGIKSFIDAFDKQLGPDIKLFGDIAGNVLKGLGSMFLGAGQQLSGGLLKYLDQMSAKFANIGQSNGFQRFLTWVKTNGPGIWHDVEQIAQAIGRMVIAAAPLGLSVLHALGGIATQLNKIPPGYLSKMFENVGPPVQQILADLPKAARAFVSLYNAAEPVFKFLLEAMGHVASLWGSVLQALGHAPGFGWAKDAGNAMKGAANAALGLANSMHKIPANLHPTVTLDGVAGSRSQLALLQQQLNGLHNKTVTVTMAINNASHAAAQRANRRASGGPVGRSTTYLVGERGPELFTPSTAGYITPNHALQQTAAIMRQTGMDARAASSVPVAIRVQHVPYTGPVAIDMGDGLTMTGVMRAVAQDEIAATR